MNQQSGPQDPLVLSYLTLRKAVGIIGLALPFILAIGKILLQGPGIEGSISYYYYTDTGNVLVGSMCAIGVFLLSTRGYDCRDRIAGVLACIFAVGVALFPTMPYPKPSPKETVIGHFHWVFAALLFLTLAYFALCLFTRTRGNPTPQKLKRNRVYHICGTLILISVALIVLVSVPPLKDSAAHLHPIFWLESLAVLSFGFAWLTKGEAILKDQ